MFSIVWAINVVPVSQCIQLCRQLFPTTLILCLLNDDAIKWKHFRVTGRLCGEFTGHRWNPRTQKGQWRWALVISLICAWMNDWVNNRETGEVRRYRAYYDVTVITWPVHGYLTGRDNLCNIAKHFEFVPSNWEKQTPYLVLTIELINLFQMKLHVIKMFASRVHDGSPSLHKMSVL